jgi:hypothetical protein
MRHLPPHTHSETVPIGFDGSLSVEGGFVCGDIVLTVWITREPSDPHVKEYVHNVDVDICDLDLTDGDGDTLREVPEDELGKLLPRTLVEYAERALWE